MKPGSLSRQMRQSWSPPPPNWATSSAGQLSRLGHSDRTAWLGGPSRHRKILGPGPGSNLPKFESLRAQNQKKIYNSNMSHTTTTPTHPLQIRQSRTCQHRLIEWNFSDSASCTSRVRILLPKLCLDMLTFPFESIIVQDSAQHGYPMRCCWRPGSTYCL